MRTRRCVCWSAVVVAALLGSQSASAWDFGSGFAHYGKAPAFLHKVQESGGKSGAIGASNQPGTALTQAAIPSLAADDILSRLKAMNISYSVPESDLRDWLANPEYTPYPAVAWGLIDLLHDRKLLDAVDLDVIVYNYERAPGAMSPRRIEDIDQAIMTAALIKGFNSRYGRNATNLSQITK